MVSRTLIIVAIILLSCRSNDIDNSELQVGSFNIEKASYWFNMIVKPM